MSFPMQRKTDLTVWHQRDRLTVEQWQQIYRPCGLAIKETPVCFHGEHCVKVIFAALRLWRDWGWRYDG